jgi:hypothetical protein
MEKDVSLNFAITFERSDKLNNQWLHLALLLDYCNHISLTISIKTYCLTEIKYCNSSDLHSGRTRFKLEKSPAILTEISGILLSQTVI